MEFQEPKVEFVAVEEQDIVTSSASQETHMCSGTGYQPDNDECSADPSLF